MKAIKKMFYSKELAPYLFLSPFILSFLIFNAYPMLNSIIMSFQKLTGFNTAKWVGLDNYKRLFNATFLSALKTTTLVAVLSTVFTIVIALLLALALNSKAFKGRTVFKTIIFVPTLASTIVAGVVFRMLFSEHSTGFMNSVLAVFGIAPQKWMLTYSWSIALMVLLMIWRSVGLYMIYFLSGFQTIPSEVYESAEIDGAGPWGKLRYITLPLLKPTALYVFTLLVYEGYRVYTESVVFWKESMPGNIGMTIVRYLYQEGFTYGNLGFAAAIGLVLLIIVLLINLVQLKFFGFFNDND